MPATAVLVHEPTERWRRSLLPLADGPVRLVACRSAADLLDRLPRHPFAVAVLTSAARGWSPPLATAVVEADGWAAVVGGPFSATVAAELRQRGAGPLLAVTQAERWLPVVVEALVDRSQQRFAQCR